MRFIFLKIQSQNEDQSYKQTFLPRKGAFSDVLESDQILSEDQIQDSQVSLDEVDTNRFPPHFQVSMTIFANNQISTFKVKILSSILVQNRLEVGIILSIPK